MIDAASPGDMIIVPPGAYNEILVMWKPVRLQGAGAASTVINANTHPAGKLDPWRAKVTCLFGLSLNCQPRNTSSNPFDPTGGQTCGGWTAFDSTHPQVDRLPLEGILGWDTTVNGNLAQLLQEPTLMGAYEGAGITVLGKGVKLPAGVNAFDPSAFGTGNESAFPAGTQLLSSGDCLAGTGTARTNPYPSNFYCNPSSIDGLSITDSSQGGGGVFVHAWAHYLQIANNRIYNNTGTLTGGITLGQGESPDAYLQGDAGNADPGSCESSPLLPGKQLPYCFDYKVSVHNNAVTSNSSIGDELYSSTPAGAGGVTICTGADYYQFNNNWVCGNLSAGDGGGLVHLGFIKNGDIEHNSILFNQSTNPTVPTNGGGLLVMGAPPEGLTSAGLECGNTAADADCTHGLSDGSGPGLVINANLIMGNSAESGRGGGVRLQNINGTEVIAFPTPCF